MLFNLLSYRDKEIDSILQAAIETCNRLDIDLKSEDGRRVLQRATNIAAGGVMDADEIVARLCAS
ncbi:hypothetical protein LJR030_002955 [Rhizobium sp. LjRoot30]|uniref:hypothetical protein n=1 Tax=Rhizobium sp. LjRoot30 TaxID=3342320 RepID=UPI003ECF1F9F